MSKGILWLTVPKQISPVKALYIPAQHLHVTLKFNVSIDSFKGDIGKSVSAELIENCWNKDIQAVTVKLPGSIKALCNNKHPHMTISHKSGIKPFKSNEMLDGEHESEKLNKSIKLIVEFYMFDVKEK